jgi:DNA polymerase elongation subunit (family B)
MEIEKENENENENEDPLDQENGVGRGVIEPGVPKDEKDWGILPRVIKKLVEKRKEVKNLLKKEKDPQ